jgi:hypothetical protein
MISTRSQGACLALLCQALLLVCPAWAQQAEAPMTNAQLTALLEQVGANSERYTKTFKDLTAEEQRHFELFASDGKLDKQHRLVTDLIVYQSQRNTNRVVEFRNIREVDGAPVKDQTERLEKLFERLSKADSTDKELQRIIKESTRYDFGYQLSGYLFYKSIASWKALQPAFRFAAIGRERIAERELQVVKFEQTQFRKDMFGLESFFDPTKFTGPMMRGTYWIDPATAEIHREHHEIFFRDNQQPAITHKVIEVDFDFAPSKYAVFLPQRVVLQFFRSAKAKKDAPIRMYRTVKVTSEFNGFRRFNTEGKQEPQSAQ